ncbi:hypothetical protein [Pyrobaculum aerophilum]|uniref:Uncharacterized protein n=1 Tax=Pyrobaculum aerophilum TaxID=13773 RepID=A0A371QYH4_9CREN|nr:hypothetical protein [Pyrobaculum aerophilum]RFA95810.1 hypothetical protein CGL52_12165 [Pyrobaculum aerophilum]RFA96175.1 hypothetical protein CGL51_05780 [Pyrobaculum aerophilum]
MWSLAYGLIALAVVAFVVMYATLHFSKPASINLADDLYAAKRKALDVFYTDSLAVFKRNSGVAYYVNVTAYDPATRKYVELGMPVAYRLQGEASYYIYSLALNATCRLYAAKAYGEPAVLYAVEIEYPLDPAPWLEVYAVVPKYANWTSYFYPGAVLTTEIVDWNIGHLFDAVKAEWALSNNGTRAVLYALVPKAAVGILVVDYPAKAFITCGRLFTEGKGGGEVERSGDSPTQYS